LTGPCSTRKTAPASVAANIPTILGLSRLADRYDAILCDVWGVLIDGLIHFPKAAEALRRFRDGGGTVILITNASRPSAEVRRQLFGLGLPRNSFDDLVSAGELTLREIIARKGQACYHLGPKRDTGLFEAAARELGAPVRLVPAGDADYVVCTGLMDERNETPDDYTERLAAMRERDLVMLCANPDIVVGVGDELLWCAGALAQRYAAIGGKVVLAGKPHPPIYRAALARVAELRETRVSTSRILAIGDGVDTDLAGAGRANLNALFIVDGIHREELRPGGGALDWAALDRLIDRAKTKPVALAAELVW
jgi:HAD superfamily hydrolase (TIGR01459 family)